MPFEKHVRDLFFINAEAVFSANLGNAVMLILHILIVHLLFGKGYNCSMCLINNLMTCKEKYPADFRKINCTSAV